MNYATCKDFFRRRWMSLRRGQVHTTQRGACPLESVGPARAGLELFATETDRQFTDLARGVSEILARIRKVTEQTRKLDAILQDCDDDRALSRAYQVYKQSVDLVHASMGVALADHDQLAKVEEKLLQSCGARGQLEQHSLVFRMVTVETRIEAMRLDHEGQLVFLTVGDAIQHMGQRINDTAGVAFGRIEAVVAETHAERHRLETHQIALHEEAQRSVGRIRTELDRMKAALEPCGAHSQAILGLVLEIEQVANAVVMALQAQDIMRQQLEHVGTGLREMEQHAEDQTLLLQAARVQRLQLNSARTRIEGAVNSLQTALARLAEAGQTLETRFVAMESSIVEAVGESKLAQLFKEETEKLSQIASQSEESNQRISQLVSRVDGVIHGFSQEVAAQQFDVTLVALNAQIAAARMPRAGALNRLAEETSAVAAAVGAMTDGITGQLREALDALRHMKEEADAFQQVIVVDRAELEAGSIQVNELLQNLQRGLHEDVTRATQEFGEVQETICRFAGELAMGERVTRCFGAADDACARLIAWCGEDPSAPVNVEVYRADHVGYTMASEYELHAKALGQETTETPAEEKKTNNQDIELF